MFYEVILGREVGKINDVLTYSSSEVLFPGTIVEVPIGKNKSSGIILKKVARPNFQTKKILRILYSKPLSMHLIQTAKWISEYYQAPLSACIGMILPLGVLKKRRTKPNKTEQKALSLTYSNIALNPAQKMALKSLQKAPGATKLLFGVTGSGKTNIYLYEALNALKRQKSVILLVPEIALTGQLVKVFKEFFSENIVLMHSKQTEATRHQIFEDLLMSEEPKIIIGPRSALFAPLNNLGLIVIDEEHDGAYYQENAPKYSAIRVASYMAEAVGCDCILGSATPTVADYYIAKQKGSLVTLPEKAKKTAIKPRIKIVDLKNRDAFLKNRYFSNELLLAITKNLEQKQQTLIFHNRRGSSPLTLCENCGEELLCPNCLLPLTLHLDRFELVCHTCGFHEKVPLKCPKCGAPDLIHKGFGTKLLESELRRLFPGARIARFDADNKKNEALEAVYDIVKEGAIDILVGTQTVAKGLDLPKLATVGIVQADAGLSLPDFAAEERVFQLITQVMGRVGRGHINKAEVFIQTFRPEHPVFNFAIHEDYDGFFNYLLKARRQGGFPPYKYVMRLDITLKTESLVVKKVREAEKMLKNNPKLLVSPPMPAFHEKTNRGYTWEIVVRATSRKELILASKNLDKNFRITLDPPGLL